MAIWKWCIVAGVIFLVIGIAVPLIVVSIENHQARNNKKLLANKTGEQEKSARSTAVIVFSRSGNTAVAGNHFANKHNADLFRLEALDYALGLKGWINALLDARKDEAVITPVTLDLSQYETIFLGSPIWLYSPAPPIWEFAKNNRFDGKKVVLFNTFNSQFKKEFINNFKTLVIENGAIEFQHIYVQRGRMGQQITTEEMIQLFDEQLKLNEGVE